MTATGRDYCEIHRIGYMNEAGTCPLCNREGRRAEC